ncbi:MAG: carbohydrate kinase [Bacillota bacterium]|jgi:fructokinase|nr:carbohydrate kinase [Bacillota bacterium]
MFDIVALGELLIDFTYHGRSENGTRLFEQNPGGAPANVLCAASNLGLSTAFIGKVGKDMHGDYLRSVLEEKGVDTSGLISAEDVFTTLAFVELSETGEREFSFSRKPGADTCLSAGEVKRELANGCRIFHFGSLSLTDEPSRSATIETVKAAKEAGAIISYDPNYRAPLWKSENKAAEIMKSVLHFADIVKISDEEVELITGESSPKAAAAYLFQKGISCAVITLGSNGAYTAVEGGSAMVPILNPDISVVDTTGAGDAFWGGFLYKLAESGLRPNELGQDQLRNFTEFANAVASLCVQKRGGIPAMPTINMVKDFLTKRGNDNETQRD